MKNIYTISVVMLLSSSIIGQTTVFNSSNNSSGLAINDGTNTLFVAAYFDDIIYSIDLNDTNFTPNILTSNINRPNDIEFSDGFLYVSSNPNSMSSDKITRIDLSDPNLTQVDIDSTIPNPDGLTIYNNSLYVNSSSNIYKIDLLNNNTTPILLIDDSSTSAGETIGLCVFNNYLYVTVFYEKLVKYDLNSSNPTKELVFNNFEGRGLTVKDDKIYSTGGSPSKIFEINPINQTSTEIIQAVIPTSWDIITNTNSIFISNFEGGEVVKYDFDNLSSIDFEFIKTIIYPNPTNHYFQFKNSQNFQNLELYDLNGKLVNINKVHDEKFDVSHLKSGVYILKFEKKFIGKIIKK